MNILAVGAHPDDIEYGCSGSLIQFANHGHNVFMLICTGGEAGGDSSVRRAEQQIAAEIIGAQDIFWGGHSDTQLPAGKELINQMEEIIHRTRPDLIFVNYWEDTHQDHRVLAKAAQSATRYIRNVLFYESPTTENFQPQVYVNITNVLERKLLALKSHASQVMRTNIEEHSILEIAHANATFRGIQGRVKFAEGFAALRYFINFSFNGET